MRKLINPQIAPVGGYRFIDPDTGFAYDRKYASLEELSNHVQQYREANGLPRIEKFQAVWEAYVCANVPQMDGRCCPVGEDISRKFTQYWAGAKAYVKAAIAGAAAFVSQEEADRRAAICAGCSENVRNYGHSHAQFYSDKFIQGQIGNRKSAYHDKLHTCRVCTCILKAKVFYDPNIVASSLSDTEVGSLMRKPVDANGRRIKCWQLEGVGNGEEEKEEA